MPKALFFVGYDAYTRPAFNMASCLIEQGWICDAYHLDLGANPLSINQKKPFANLETITFTAWEKLVQDSGADCIFIGFGGRAAMRVLDMIRAAAPNAKAATFFPGICWGDTDNGLLVRSKADLVLCNTQSDVNFYRELGQIYGFDTGNGRVLGYPHIYKVDKRPPVHTFKDIHTITYFDQNIMPQSRTERMVLAERLIALAKRFPDKQVCIKMRNTAQETTAHKGKNDLRTLLATRGTLPSNMSFSQDDILACMEKTDLALSVTSTVLLEAMARGILTYALADFGVRHHYGSPYFMGSGVLKNFADVEREVIAYPDPAWLEAHAPAMNTHGLAEAASSNKDERRTVSQALEAYFEQRKVRRTRLGKFKRVFVGTAKRIKNALSSLKAK